MSSYDIFHALHHQPAPLLIGNAWNAHSAQIMQQSGIKAIATSSSAIAGTLGYKDGEQIPFEELFFMVRRIISSVQVPVSADIERGYSSDVQQVIRHITQLHDIGVVGINLEDSTADEVLLPIDEFRHKLETIKNHLAQKNMRVFINARTDTFLLPVPNALEATFERITAYTAAGADSIFVPFICEPDHIRQVTAASTLPVNVLSMRGLPSFDELQALGVKRISMGGSVWRATYEGLARTLQQIQEQHSFNTIF